MKKIAFIIGGVAVFAAGIALFIRYMNKELTGFMISDLDLDWKEID